MKTSLKIKKFILKTVLSVLIAGYAFSFFMPKSDNTEKEIFLLLSNNVSAASAVPTLELPTFGNTTFTQNNSSINSKMKDIEVNKEEVRKIREYLAKRGAPLADYAETFVKIADKYNLPYNLMPAIAVIESGGGKVNYRPYNYAGMGGQGGAMVFNSYEQAIETHAKIIKNGYFDKGATTPEQMEKYYCYNCPTWGEKVQGVMNAIDAE